MSNKQRLIGILSLAATGALVGVAAVAWWARRAAEPTVPLEPEASRLEPRTDTVLDALDDLPPDSTVFEPAPLSDRNITARPRAHASHWLSGDDYEAIGADDLGAAFLARATDALSDDPEDESELDELAGFRIVQPE